MLDELFVYCWLAGFVLAIAGALALLVVAFRTRLAWGVGMLLVPPIAVAYVVRYPRRARWPTSVLALGLAAMAGPALYTRYWPIDLGERRRVVDGEVHLTLTGWDRTDYAAALRRNADAAVVQMANPDVTDRTLTYLDGMTALRELDLSHTRVSDAGLRVLARLPRLRTLRLRDTRLTDAGLTEALGPIETLTRLDVAQTEVSAAALDAWIKSRPGRRGVR